LKEIGKNRPIMAEFSGLSKRYEQHVTHKQVYDFLPCSSKYKRLMVCTCLLKTWFYLWKAV